MGSGSAGRRALRLLLVGMENRGPQSLRSALHAAASLGERLLPQQRSRRESQNREVGLCRSRAENSSQQRAELSGWNSLNKTGIMSAQYLNTVIEGIERKNHVDPILLH
jgi:hypothetical protein